jgi:serine/threonine-protein kinase
VQGVLGRGGMGVVYQARHLRLNRPVALKMLLAGAYAGPHDLARFLREAETVAGLRHANIVQVHEAGDVDGRPYFTMELVEGGSRAQKLAGTPQPARQAAALVAAVAEAVHAAHLRGIVHRDLKPGNILLTADGTPKLTDFGVARRLEGTAGLTQSGAPLGTPSYMAPEQAEGRSREVGPAADTYALGAILYELLTGRPPFRAETAAETLRQVVSQDPVPPSRLNAAVPRDPETICLKCLEKDPRRRYASAAALAEDLRRFQRNEPIVARAVGPLERALRWTRRKPTAAALVATALALIGLATGGGAWLVQQRAGRRAELRSEVGTAVAQAVSLRKRFHFHEARELLEQARQQLELTGPDELRRQVDQAQADLELVENLDSARLRVAITVEGSSWAAGAELLYEKTLAKAGLSRPGDDSEAAAARVRDSALSAEIVAALDDWASITQDPARRKWLLAVARGADPDSSRDRLRQPELWDDGPGLTNLVNELPADELSTQLTTALGRVLFKTGGDAVLLLRAAQARYPQDFWLNFELGWALSVSGRIDEALGFYRAALALRPEASSAHNGVGLTLHALGRVDEAIGHFEQALIIDPNFAVAHNNLGHALRAKGRLDEAIGHYQEAIRLDPKASAPAHNNLGEVLRGKGRLDEAIGHLQEAIRLDPKVSAAAHNNLGVALRAKGQLDQAIGHFQESIRLDPKGSALAHYYLGSALRAKGRPDEAIGHLQQALQLNPKLTIARHSQGLAHAARQEWDKAAGCYKRVLEDGATDDGHFWFEYAAVLLLSGDRKGYEKACAHMVERYGKSPALRSYHVARACTLAPGAVADVSQPGRLAGTELKAGAGQFWSLTAQGALRYRAGQFQEAAALFEQSLRASTKPGQAVLNWLWLALAQQRLGKTEEARRWLGKATAWLDQYRDRMPDRAEGELGLHLDNWLEAHVLRREAEAMIRPAGPR